MRFFVLSGGTFHKKQYCTSVPNPNSVDLHSRMVDIEQKLDSLENREDFAQLKQDVQQQISSISANVKLLTDQLVQLQNKIDGQEPKGTDEQTLENMVELTVKEIEERENRKKCLLVYDLPEKTGAGFEEQRLEDRNQLMKIFNDEMGLDVKIIQNFRFRSTKFSLSPVSVQFSSPEDVRKVVSSFLNLHLQKFQPMEPKIRVRAAYTKMQQKALQDEVSRRNSKAQSLGLGTPWYIGFSGEILKRIPRE